MTADLHHKASEFILRREANDWSEADELDLEAWLAQSARHQAIYWRLESAWEKTGEMDSRRNSAFFAGIGRVFHAGVLKAAVAVAATTLPLAAGWWLMGPSPGEGWTETYQTAVGARKIVSLPDGSSVDMNTDTQIQIAYDGEQRLVRLQRGEAYFEVAHEQQRPFLVEAGDHRILDIGTKFLVRREGNTITAAVAQGKVSLSRLDRETSPQLVLAAGDRAVAQGHSTLTVSNDMAYINAALSWRQGLLRFENSTLGEVVAQFNRYNESKIHIADQATASVRIGGAFAPENVDGFLQVLSDAYGIRIEKVREDVRISRR